MSLSLCAIFTINNVLFQKIRGVGTPHLPGHKGGGVTPSQKKERGGVGGSPPPPHGRKPALFCMAKSCISRGITGVKCGFWWFSDSVVAGPPGPDGEGVPPCWAGTWVGGDPLFKKKKEGGRGITPPPPVAFPGPVCTLVRLFLPGHYIGDLSHGYRHGPGEGDLFWDHQKF